MLAVRQETPVQEERSDGHYQEVCEGQGPEDLLAAADQEVPRDEEAQPQIASHR